MNLRSGASPVGRTRAVQGASILIASGALLADRRFTAGVAAIVALAGYQMVTARSTPTSAVRLGITQMVLGLAVVIVTAIGVAAA